MEVLKDVVAPIALLIVGIVGKWIIKSKWEDEIVFMGPDLVLAGIGAGIVHLLDQLGFLSISQTNADLKAAGLNACYSGIYLMAAGGFYLLTLKLHQGFPRRKSKRRARFVALGVIGNAIGMVAVLWVIFLLRKP